ncbi:MAG: response regulator [Nitrospirota bacterium]
MNILLAEDDKNLGFILKHELEGDGYYVDLVHDGVEAVLRFLDVDYDVLLFDIRMPRLDGITALRIIKRMKSDVFAVIFSGHAGPDDREAAVRAGAAACLEKPFEIAAVRQYLKSISTFAPSMQLAQSTG